MSDETPPLTGLNEVYRRIRKAILQGEISPNARMSQVKLAERFGLSRTPVREALRMLESEGLIRAERGRQVVIAPTSMRDLDELYALRINLDSTTVRMTVPLLKDSDVDEMHALLNAMEAAAASSDIEGYDVAHRQFHLIAIRDAGPRHVSQSTRLNEHAERYRWLYLLKPSSWAQSSEEHREILAACAERNEERVARLLTEHYARIALTIVAWIEPAFEPSLVRAAVRGVMQRLVPDTEARKDRAERQARSAISKQAS